MLLDLTSRRTDRVAAFVPAQQRCTPHAAYDAVARLTRLRDQLDASRPPVASSAWCEPPVFFFDPQRQEELNAVRPRHVAQPPPDLVAAELPLLCSSVEVRRVARAIPGLLDAATRHGARDLVDLLSMPEDEVVLVLHPESRLGFRLAVRGVFDVAQFQLLMIDALGDHLPGPPLSWRFRKFCTEANPVIPAGVPMTIEARYQCYRPEALQPDGTLPSGFQGCAHWLWGTYALAVLPRVEGERVLVLGPPVYRQQWDVSRRFPAMAAEVQLVDVLTPFRVVERLSRLVGRPLPVNESVETDVPVLARAA